MELDYTKIGKRIAARRRMLGLKQAEVSELADISNTYMSSIERAVSIPSTEVIMRLAQALDTTPDEFLVGTSRAGGEEWKSAAQYLLNMNGRKLDLAKKFLAWLSEQDL
ncbi:MAG: helix-turn-helix transcriptional regulator [Oscillibacter sp.]|nr:helix-turn-helix transcriptional regulator [Oscillibacter sp.]